MPKQKLSKINFSVTQNKVDPNVYNLDCVFENDIFQRSMPVFNFQYKPAQEQVDDMIHAFLAGVNNYRYVKMTNTCMIRYVKDEPVFSVEEQTISPEFQVGDRVKVTKCYFQSRIGMLGTVLLTNSKKVILVEHDNNFKATYQPDEIEKVDNTCEKTNFKVGQLVQLKDDNNIIHAKRFGIIRTIFIDIIDLDLGTVLNKYFIRSVQKLSIETFPDSLEFKQGSIIQVLGNRHRFSKRFGIIISSNNNVHTIDFGDFVHNCHQKNLSLI